MADDLLALARAAFRTADDESGNALTPAETLLLEETALDGGGYLPPGKVVFDHDGIPSGIDEARCIRARVLRWLFLDPQAREILTPLGVFIEGAVVVNEVFAENRWTRCEEGAGPPLDLAAVAAPFGLRIRHSNIDIGVTIAAAQLHSVDFHGSRLGSLEAENVEIFSDTVLAHAEILSGPVDLDGAEIRGDLICEGLKIAAGAEGAVFARGLEVRGSVYFDKAHIHRRVYMQNCRIQGDLSFNDAKILASHCVAPEALTIFWNAVQRGAAPQNGPGFKIDADDEARAAAHAPDALPEAPLTVKGRREAYYRTQGVRLDDCTVGGSLRFERCACDERIRAKNCKVEGDVEIFGTDFTLRDTAATDIYELIHELAAKYLGRARAAGIGDDYLLRVLADPPMGERGLILTNGRIGQSLLWMNVRVEASTILHLNLTKTRAFYLTPERQCWPATNNLGLIQFEMDDLSSFIEVARGRKSDHALAWLEREQPRARRWRDRWEAHAVWPVRRRFGEVPPWHGDGCDIRSPATDPHSARRRDFTSFQPQPYRMMAHALMSKGHQDDALDVQVEMERRIRVSTRRDRWVVVRAAYAFVSLLLNLFIDYGYRPLKAFKWILCFVLLGTLVFATAYESGLLSITSEGVYLDSRYDDLEGARRDPDSEPPRQYIAFDAFLYSTDAFVPILDFGQEARWFPNAKKANELCLPEIAGWGGWCSGWVVSGRWFELYLNLFHIPFGWLISTLFAFGVTGLAKRGGDDT